MNVILLKIILYVLMDIIISLMFKLKTEAFALSKGIR